MRDTHRFEIDLIMCPAQPPGHFGLLNRFSIARVLPLPSGTLIRRPSSVGHAKFAYPPLDAAWKLSKME